MSTFRTSDGCCLAYESVGEGMPVLWQHGLGADRRQPAEVFPNQQGVRRITLECRGHGESELGDPSRISMASFAEDGVALLDHLGVSKAVVGGISLGAGIALRLAVFHPGRVLGLILARPAWIDGPSLTTLAPYAEAGRLLREFGAEVGEARFVQSQQYRDVLAVSPDNAQSLRSLFTRPSLESTLLLLAMITQDCPAIGGAFDRVTVPTLILANDHEFVHPIAYAQELLQAIPQATLKVITSKTINRQAYVDEFRNAVGAFLAGLESAE